MPTYMDSELDLCGLGTRWGCGQLVSGFPCHILVKGRKPISYQGGSNDDGHVLFHVSCTPALVEPDAVQRWSGSHTGCRQRSVV